MDLQQRESDRSPERLETILRNCHKQAYYGRGAEDLKEKLTLILQEKEKRPRLVKKKGTPQH